MSETTPLDAAVAADLLHRATALRRRAYAPYSGFAVGAALLDSDGGIHTGVNVENASYGLTICAERSAIFRAVAEGSRGVRAIAIAGPDDVACMPCGSCRQVLHEFNADAIVVVAAAEGEPRQIPLRELLPEAFGSPGPPHGVERS